MFEIRLETKDSSLIDNQLNLQLWDLYSSFHSTSFEDFTERWKSLDRVAIFYHRKQGNIIGFIGIRNRSFVIMNEQQKMERVQTIYFGQVFIQHRFRGKLLVQRTVTSLLFKQKIRRPFSTVYFWTDAISYKPFLIMTNNLAEYYPNPFNKNPAKIDGLIDVIGSTYFSDVYQVDSGTVLKPQYVLNDKSVEITKKDLQNPFISFFVNKNPDHIYGTGLIITCPLSFKNLLHFLSRRITKTLFPKKFYKSQRS